MRSDAPSTAILRFAPGDLGGAIATLFDCMFMDPTGETDAAGMVATARELVQYLASAGAGAAADRVRQAAHAAFERARRMGEQLEEEATAREREGGGSAAGGDASAVPAEAGDASGMEWLLPEDFEERDFVLEEGSTLALQLQQAQAWIENAGRYQALGLDCPTGILLTGPAGTGKTTAAHRLAAKTGRPLGIARQDALESRFIGQNLKNLRAMLAEAVERRALILFDEVDGIARDRKLAGPGEGHRVELLDSFLEQLTILRKRHPDQVMLAATNVPEVLDPSFVRRVAVSIEFDFPGLKARAQILAGLYTSVDIEEDARDFMLTRTDGRSGDYLRSVAMTAARTAVDDLGAEALAVLDQAASAARAASASDEGSGPRVLPVHLPRPLVARAHVTKALAIVRDQAAARAAAKTRTGVVLVG